MLGKDSGGALAHSLSQQQRIVSPARFATHRPHASTGFPSDMNGGLRGMSHLCEDENGGVGITNY